MTPQVSVVMSIYNDAPHLVETMESVLSQNGVDLEFVIVNDGSSDESAAVLQEYARRDARIRVVVQENRGLTLALIRGCGLALGPYIARQDAGDWSLPGRLCAQWEVLEADPGLAFVSCWTEFRGPAGEYLYTKKDRGLAHTPRDVRPDPKGGSSLLDGPTCHPSVMFRKESYERVGGYRPEFRMAQDWDLWYRLAEVGRFQSITSTLYGVRVLPRGLSLTHRPIQLQLGALAREAFEARRRDASEAEILDRASRLRPVGGGSEGDAVGGYYFIGEALRRNGDARCREYFEKALERRPLHWKSWMRLAQSVTTMGR